MSDIHIMSVSQGPGTIEDHMYTYVRYAYITVSQAGEVAFAQVH